MPQIFTANDEKVFEAVYRMRLATIYEVMEYTGFARKNAEKHIGRVKKQKLIFPKDRGSTVAPLYSDDEKYFGRLSELTFEHELLISRTHARLHQSFTLEDWQQENIHTKHVRPDAFFTLAKGDLALDYYLEADNYKLGRSDNREQMLKKWKGYASLFQERVEKHGPFRVLTVTTSEARAKNLARNCEEVIGRGARHGYLFTTVERLKSDPAREICFVPYEDNRKYQILP